jgi:hypothetical protein
MPSKSPERLPEFSGDHLIRRRNMELVEQNHELQAKKARRAAACDCGAASIKDLTHATWCSSHE